MSAGEAKRQITMARIPGKTTHERQQHILTALEQLVMAVHELETKMQALLEKLDSTKDPATMK